MENEKRSKKNEESKRTRKRLSRTTTIYLHGQLLFVSSPMELDHDLDRRVKERRLNEETALESSGWRGGKRSKKASGKGGGKKKEEKEKEEKKRWYRGIERDGNLSLL